MFEKVIEELDIELRDKLHPALAKCLLLKQKVGGNKELETRLVAKGAELGVAINRAALCLDILKYKASIEISDDWKTVRVV